MERFLPCSEGGMPLHREPVRRRRPEHPAILTWPRRQRYPAAARTRWLQIEVGEPRLRCGGGSETGHPRSERGTLRLIEILPEDRVPQHGPRAVLESGAGGRL